MEVNRFSEDELPGLIAVTAVAAKISDLDRIPDRQSNLG